MTCVYQSADELRATKEQLRIHCLFVSVVKLIWTKKAVQLIFGEFFKRLVHFQGWSLTYFEQYIYLQYNQGMFMERCTQHFHPQYKPERRDKVRWQELRLSRRVSSPPPPPPPHSSLSTHTISIAFCIYVRDLPTAASYRQSLLILLSYCSS